MMAYRMDWRVTLRAVRRGTVEELFAQIDMALGSGLIRHGEWRTPKMHSCWDVSFSTPEWSMTFPESVVHGMRQAHRIGEHWRFSLSDEDEERLTGEFTDEVSGERMIGVARAKLAIVPADLPFPMAAPPHIPEISNRSHYEVDLHIEAEPERCIPDNCSSIVNVRFDSGEIWVAHFYTIGYVTAHWNYLSAMSSKSGNCFWVSGLVLIKEITRVAVEETIADMMEEGTFQRAFEWSGVEGLE
ncbi:MAG: hypothetical protein ACYDCO_17695 [Armatimonadota bacterium]